MTDQPQTTTSQTKQPHPAVRPTTETSTIEPHQATAPIHASRGSLHHLEIWVPDLASARMSWGWLLAELGYVPFQDWENGFSVRLGGTYLVFEQSAAISAPTHDRRRPGLNHLALHSGSQSRVDRLYASAQDHGWTPLFADEYPWAGGAPSETRAGHYAAFLVDDSGFEVELVAAPADVVLRPVAAADLDVFFRIEQDREANRIAAFTVKDPTDRGVFDARWHMIRNDPNVFARTILVGGRVAGSVMTYVEDDNTEVTYWIGREFWGRGVATTALRGLLGEVTERPIRARTVKDNAGSLAVLQRCGFTIIGEDSGYANARGTEVEEFILELR